MSVSIICACKNRNAPLKISLSSWLSFSQISEIIIVDWSSDESLNNLINLDPRIKIISVPNQKYFNQPEPLNLAASLATGDYILKVDADYILNPYYNFFDFYKVDNTCFVCGENGYTQLDIIESPYFRYLRGLLYVTRENFLKIGGFNENITKYYAYEDDEIDDRLELLGLEKNKLCYNHNIIHIPHQDKKRFENFEAYHVDTGLTSYVYDGLSTQYSGDELQWQADYIIAQQHIEKNRQQCISEDMGYHFQSKIKWDVTKINDQLYVAEKLFTNKLKDFPTAYYISLEESVDRQKNITEQFSQYGITPIPIISKRFAESDDIVTGKYLHQLNAGTTGCCVSHLKAIKEWYNTTNEDYAFFCEDDLSLETVEHWNFTWSEFVSNLPPDWDCIQLLPIRGDYLEIKLRERWWDDWSVTAYILTRSYAKKIIDTFCIDDTYNLELSNQDIMPLIENIIYSSGKTYTIPLFVECTNFGSTFSSKDDTDVKDGQKNNHYYSQEFLSNWWKTQGINSNIETLMNNQKTELEKLLITYANDTENSKINFLIGLWYEREGHTAPALSYFLRSAERSDDVNFQYLSLIKCYFCYERQGTRDNTAKSILLQAMSILPKRPEAYYLACKFHEKRNQWSDCYSYACQALGVCEFNLEALECDIEYPGKYGLFFGKAISAYWWGKGDEARETFTYILDNYDLPYEDKKLIHDNIIRIGGKIKNTIDNIFNDDFDWANLTYSDIVTIKREIRDENVYGFWREVKQNDIVMDIGASVGPFVSSILNKNPQKVYCVEPSKNLLKTLSKNCAEYLLNAKENPLIYINKAICDESLEKVNIFGGEDNFETTSFKQIISDYQIEHINFLKIDCEGGEYSIFKDENMNFLLNNVDFMAIEMHLKYARGRDNFKIFRDNYLTQFKNYKVMSCTTQSISHGNSIEIAQNIFDDNFIEEYNCEFMIYIMNR
jgi:FkbM family methyltransferase